MTPLEIIKGVLVFIVLTPKIVTLIGGVLDLMNEGVDWLEIQKRLDQFTLDIKTARETKDATALENEFRNATTRE